MILLINTSANGPQCADSLYAPTGQETQWASTLQEGATRLREQTYSAAVIDQFLLETEPEESDQMIEHLGAAFPVYLNFALTGMDDWCARYARLFIAGGARNSPPAVPLPNKCIAR
jgi:hypothetical protein